MSTKPKPTNKTAAQALFTQYSLGPGNLEGWWAQPDGDGILVHRHDGSSRLVSIGEDLPIGRVEIDGPTLKVGSHSLPYINTEEKGLRLMKGAARALGKSKNKPQAYMADLFVEDPSSELGVKKRSVRLVEGSAPRDLNGLLVHGPSAHGSPEKASGTDIVSFIEGSDKKGHLKVGKYLIPVEQKEYELMLLVQNEEERGGYKAYMNYKEPGSKNNMKDGIRGVFIKAKGAEPAKFCETGPDGELYPTGVFWSTLGRYATPSDIRKLVSEMEKFGVAKEQAEADINHAIKEHGARYHGLSENLEYCKKRNNRLLKEGKPADERGNALKPGYVRKAIQEGFVDYSLAQTNFANVQVRPQADAITERDAFRELKALNGKMDRLQAEVEEAGIEGASIEDHWEYDPDESRKRLELETELDRLKNSCWQQKMFSFIRGAKTMHRTILPGMSRKPKGASREP